LFRNSTSARLIIGSNNLTEPGLFTNTEASLQIDAPVSDHVIDEVLAALDSWCDTAEGFARILDADSLTLLEDHGYIFREKELARRRQQQRKSVGGPAPRKSSLFKSKTVPAPAPPEGTATGPAEDSEPAGRTPRPSITGTVRAPGHANPIVVTNVLLMRVRPSRGGTQVQIPIPLRNSQFLTGIDAITSGHDRKRRVLSPTRPKRTQRKKVNTIKIEIPETRGIKTPVLRLERSAEGITYFAYDADSRQGRPILDALQDGYDMVPRQTVLTKPSDLDRSTWYRFV
jgi:hypothetical protein